MNDDAPTDLDTLAFGYLNAFQMRDLDRCLAFFASNATLDFHFGKYQGIDAIRQWHRDRWAANVDVIRVDTFVVRGNVVTIDATVVSDRLMAWQIKELNTRVTMRFDGAAIRDIKLSPHLTSPVEIILGDSGQ